MAALKPCPFCGGEANILCRSTLNEREILSKVFSIQCTECGVASPKAFRVFAQIYNDGTFEFNSSEKAKAIEAWNKRADVQEVRHGKNVGKDYAACDQFVCSNCGIELQDWVRVKRDDEDVTFHEYVFKHCPECGAKMDEEVE